MGFFNRLKNLAQKGVEKMQEMRAEIDEEKMYDVLFISWWFEKGS